MPFSLFKANFKSDLYRKKWHFIFYKYIHYALRETSLRIFYCVCIYSKLNLYVKHAKHLYSIKLTHSCNKLPYFAPNTEKLCTFYCSVLKFSIFLPIVNIERENC